MFLPSECLKQLKCSICNRFLSLFPIYVRQNDNQLLSVCGRCQVPEDQNYLRNEIYETLAKNILFPCINKEYGCMEDLLPEDIKQHELTCRYRLENCSLCKWKGRFNKLLDHYKTEHAKLILEDYKFNINVNEEFLIENLLLHKDTIFLFKRNFDQTSKRMKCSMTPLLFTDTDKLKKYYAEITLETDDSLITKRFPEIYSDKDKSYSIDINIENILKQNDTMITGIMKITTKKQYNMNYDTRQNDENYLFATKANENKKNLSIDHCEQCQYDCGFMAFASDLEQHYN